jgi:hypothetical protein
MSPQQMQQMLAQYKQISGAQPVAPLNPAPAAGYEGQQPGINTQGQPSTGAAATSGTAKLIAALMKAQQQKQLGDQLSAQNSMTQQMPAINQNQGQAIDSMMQQIPVAPITGSQ